MIYGHYSDLEGKAFLITGASSGIGKAIASALIAQNARVVITGRDDHRLNETLSSLGERATAIRADLTSEAERESLIGNLPDLDGICHAAGIVSPFPVRYINDAEIQKTFSINTLAPMLITSRLLGMRKLKKDASVVFLSSISSDRCVRGGAIYSASKAALEAFSRTITIEHSIDRIRANCIKPALVNTPIYEKTLEKTSEKAIKDYMDRAPLGIGHPDDVAAAALFLLSSASRWITSTSITLDGGLTASS